MSIQITERDKKRCTPEYVLSLEKANSLFNKLRWFFLAMGIIQLTMGILDIFFLNHRDKITYSNLISGCVLIVMTIFIFIFRSIPQRRYEKGKAIREILDAEETEKAEKNIQEK
jgi:hypothetical protein